MRSLRSIATTLDSSVRPNVRNSTAGSTNSRWHTDMAGGVESDHAAKLRHRALTRRRTTAGLDTRRRPAPITAQGRSYTIATASVLQLLAATGSGTRPSFVE